MGVRASRAISSASSADTEAPSGSSSRASTRTSSSRSSSASVAPPRDVQLVWPGRQWRMKDEPAEELVAPQATPIERTGDGTHRLLHGDALDLAALLEAEGTAGKVDLVYVDPPFASDRDYVAEARLDGRADGRVLRSLAYEDTWSSRDGGIGAYLDMLAPRLDALVRLLGSRGTIWVHLDWRAAYLVRAILDEIMGRDAFMNEIVWRRAPNLGRQATSGQFGRTLDTLVVYGKKDAVLTPPTRLEPIDEGSIRWDDQGRPFTSAPRGDYTDASIAKLEAEGRIHRTPSGRVYIKYFLVKNGEGVLCRERRVDALWTDVAPLRHAIASERTGYPTQKPRALLERIVACSTPPGGLVVDAFGGSGTTAVAANALGRRAILSDRSPIAIATQRSRLMREGASVRIERVVTTAAPKAIAVRVNASTGEDDRVRVELLEPAEPLAWSVGELDEGIFTTLWHSERTPGARAIPASREAIVAGAHDRHGLKARVWGDDGAMSTIDVSTGREVDA